MVKIRENGTKDYRTNENSEEQAPDLMQVDDEQVLDLLRNLTHIAPGSPKDKAYQRRINRMQNGCYEAAQRLFLKLTITQKERPTNRTF
ncbi:hypothetical protein EXS65_03580 [Candidatus Peribacteria bacterium]|nr:hypothetical protein [Candidatus Peribacteria bacterium]